MDLVREERLELEPDVVGPAVRERERASLNELLLFVLEEDIVVCLIVSVYRSKRVKKTRITELQQLYKLGSPRPF